MPRALTRCWCVAPTRCNPHFFCSCASTGDGNSSVDGWGKLNHLPKVTEYFGSLGLPAPGPTAVFVSILELVGGVLLALGLGSRLIALLLTGNMTVAYITGDREALLSIFSDPDKFSAAAPFTYLMASLIVLIFGPGRFSLDWSHRAVIGPAIRRARAL